ncbi:hypothetical protein AKG08_08900 [Achromobacter piechaudii]|uniref:hypothetical protein n=1 Tax=Achromobacter piechaudii TaxID=72556 RepID=UPI00068103FD|nr:hypothetical protein [Achromobacter piechaudii]KNY11757.1 hypothetical protein AKG08_08900 [Achromobacter piechaudii]
MNLDTPVPGSASAIEPNVRASSYIVLRTSHTCRHCQCATPVYALALAPGYESTDADIELDDDGASSGLGPLAFRDWLFRPEAWQCIDGPALLSQLGMLPADVAQTLGDAAPALRPDPDVHGQWTNFCEHCGRAVWEGDLYPTAGQPFCPKDAAAAAHIAVHTVHAPFAAYASMIWSDSYRNKWPLFARLGVACSEAD